MTFMDDYLAVFGITGIINVVQLKKWKHFVVVLSETTKKKHQLQKYMFGSLLIHSCFFY